MSLPLWRALGIIGMLNFDVSSPSFTHKWPVTGPVNGFTRTVTVPLKVEPTSLMVQGCNRFYSPQFRNFTDGLMP
jgi:hypothetical protein